MKPEVVATAVGGDDIKALRQQVVQLGLHKRLARINNQQDWPDGRNDLESFDRVAAVNYRAAMLLGQAVARAQIAGGTTGGRHVHLLSVRSQLGMRDRGYSPYCGSKGGLVMLVSQHALELAPHDITVNGVAPTVARTVMPEHWFADPARREKLL